jgi:hypothetical protein
MMLVWDVSIAEVLAVQNRSSVEIEFRMNRLSVRLERLAAHFEELAQLLAQGGDSGNCLKYVQECKFFIEWTGIDLDVDHAYELVQMQRQLVQWQRNWDALFGQPVETAQISQQLRLWSESARSMTSVLA